MSKISKRAMSKRGYPIKWCGATFRHVLESFELYKHQQNEPKKVFPKFFACVCNVKTKSKTLKKDLFKKHK